MTMLSTPVVGPDGLDGLAREIAAQLSLSGGTAAQGSLRRSASGDGSRPELATALTSVSRAADLLASARAERADAQDRAEGAERRANLLQTALDELEDRLAGTQRELEALRGHLADTEMRARARLDATEVKLAEARDRLAEAEARAEQAEENLQHLLRVVLDRLKV